jgi:alkanesulfonate monooxygenase SsuD/methylene tetrahydromethanopterin reductase-like flavin-dependent oxidoreductase (luciferase family)
MRYGMSLPNFGSFADARLVAEVARDAEAAGWDGFYLWDHVYWSVFPMGDPWIELSAVALATDRLRIGPMVTPLPRRRPTKLARETVTLDRLSGGRLTLGVGLGVRAQEWDHLGEETDLRVRGEMLDESLEILSALWRGEALEHRGSHYTVDVRDMAGYPGPVHFLPTPVQQPRIPVWVAGRWPNPRPFRRGARWDGIFPTTEPRDGHDRLTPAELRACVDYTLAQRTDDGPFDVVIGGRTVGLSASDARDRVDAYREAGATWWLEDLSPFAFGWSRKGEWPLDRMRDHVRQGPPR